MTTSLLLVTVVDPNLIVERFQMIMTNSLLRKGQKFSVKIATKTMLCKLGAQSLKGPLALK